MFNVSWFKLFKFKNVVSSVNVLIVFFFFFSKAVKHNLKTECKCHGVSGSCTMRTCWKSLPPFSLVGDYLMGAYKRSKKVTITPQRAPKHLLKLKAAITRGRPKGRVRPRDLVFLEESPNYCERDPSSQSQGTEGRDCNRTSRGVTDGSCDLLCCGRGYDTHQYTRTWQCNCKFHWCCYVNCHTCREKTERYVCK